MRLPSAADIIRVWEFGREKPAWYRGLLMLAPAFPSSRFNDLAALTLGQRNIRLFKLRQLLFGPQIEAVLKCPHCQAASEFSAAISDLCPSAGVEETEAEPVPFVLTVQGVAFTCRCLTSQDLAAFAEAAPEKRISIDDPVLLLRAVQEASLDGSLLALDGLPPAAAHAVKEGLLEHDPQLDLQLLNECVECGHNWSVSFDCIDFIWTELSNLAQRLLKDVQRLAGAYGWRETDILAMSASRRQFYLEAAPK